MTLMLVYTANQDTWSEVPIQSVTDIVHRIGGFVRVVLVRNYPDYFAVYSPLYVEDLSEKIPSQFAGESFIGNLVVGKFDAFQGKLLNTTLEENQKLLD